MVVTGSPVHDIDPTAELLVRGEHGAAIPDTGRVTRTVYVERRGVSYEVGRGRDRRVGVVGHIVDRPAVSKEHQFHKPVTVIDAHGDAAHTCPCHGLDLLSPGTLRRLLHVCGTCTGPGKDALFLRGAGSRHTQHHEHPQGTQG